MTTTTMMMIVMKFLSHYNRIHSPCFNRIYKTIQKYSEDSSSRNSH